MKIVPQSLPIVGRLLRWAVPGVLLALMPKCPACLAAYVALTTGIGVSFPVAQVLRVTLLTLSLVSLAWLAWRKLRTWRANNFNRG